MLLKIKLFLKNFIHPREFVLNYEKYELFIVIVFSFAANIEAIKYKKIVKIPPANYAKLS